MSLVEFRKLPDAKLSWTVYDKLGEGTYGEVYRVKRYQPSSENSNEEYGAAKIIRINSNEIDSDIKNEFEILQKFSEQQGNLPRFIGLYMDVDTFLITRIWFVMELCHYGPITGLLKKFRTIIQTIDCEKIIAYALQSILQALQFLHRSGIMHRDIKGSHVLVTDTYLIKLIDFGVATLFNNDRPKRNSSVGTSLWMAPEVIACAHQLDYAYDARCDIWSLGITAIELADDEAPLARLHPTKVLLEIPRRPPPTLANPARWSKEFCQFISVCLVKDYERRPDAQQLLTEQPFVNLDQTTVNNYRDILKKFHQNSSPLNTISETQPTSEQQSTMNDEYATQHNPWIVNASKSAQWIDDENDLAQVNYLDEHRLIESLRRRFTKSLIYTRIGDVLIAFNPKQYLPIDSLHFQLKYLKTKQDLLPHVFAIATSVYNQMMISRQAQCIILSGESGSGKTHAAQNLISELALLGFGEERTFENHLVTMNLLLESFGNAQTILNNNSSRFGKLLNIFFSSHGTIVYAQLSQFLLEKTRVVLASGNKRNFHIFYSIFQHFATAQPSPCDLVDSEAFELFKTVKNYAYLGGNDDDSDMNSSSSLTLNDLFRKFTELNFDLEEQSSILAILTALIHLGNISFQPQNETNEPGCSIMDNAIPHLNAVQRLLRIDNEQLIQSLCESSLMTRGETVTKLNTIEEAQQTRDAMAKSLYSRLFDWIVFALNRYFRVGLEFKPTTVTDVRKRYKNGLENGLSIRPKLNNEHQDFCSISILDLFGFETFEHNSYEQLCINIANEQLQYFFRQHTFAWEMQEYENEGITKPSNTTILDFPNNRGILDMCLSKPIGLLALLDEESRFPQSTEFTLVNKWRQNLVSSHFTASTPSTSLSRNTIKRRQQLALAKQPLFTIHHYAGSIEYSAKDFLEKNRDYVPMEIVDLLLQSDDRLVNLLFRSRLRKTGSVIYSEQEKLDKTAFFRTVSSHKNAVSTANRTQGTVSTYFRYSLMELVSAMASAQPTFIRCLVPNRLPSNSSHIIYDHTSYFPADFTFDSSQFDENIVLEQIQYSGLLETIDIRKHGYSHRIPIADFIALYSCLIDFRIYPSNTNNQLCKTILNKFNLTDYAIGKTKIFLKFHHIEQLNLAHKRLITSLIHLQSYIRMHLIYKQKQKPIVNIIKSKEDLAAARIQAVVRGFLVRRTHQTTSLATVKIQTYWRMWYERARFKRMRLNYRNEQFKLSYFSKQIELFGNHSFQQISNLTQKIDCSIKQSSHEDETKEEAIPPKPIQRKTTNFGRKVFILSSYYDAVYKEYIKRKNQEISNDNPMNGTNTVSQRPSTAPLISSVPEAPPCPPPDFFKMPSNEIQVVKRQTSAPATVTLPVEELKLVLAARQLKQPTTALPVMSFRPVSPPPFTGKRRDSTSPSAFLSVSDINRTIVDENPRESRRRLSSSSSLIQGKYNGPIIGSTSSMVGDMILTQTDVILLKDKLRKTGFAEGNQTLRRKLPTEPVQHDFRNILRSTKRNF